MGQNDRNTAKSIDPTTMQPGLSFYRDGIHYYATPTDLYMQTPNTAWVQLRHTELGNESRQVIIDEFTPEKETR